MRLTQQSLANPAAVTIIALVVVMLGVLSILNIPAQLLPQIEKPVVTVIVSWPGAAPKEVEAELMVPVEEVLQGTPGMTEMFSWNMPNFGFMQLEFALETDMTRTLIEIISRLNRLRPLPANAERPYVSLGEWGDANDQLIEYFVQQVDGDERRLVENKRFLREVIRPQIASLYGVAQVDMFDASGNASDQLQIIVDPYKAAEFGIDIARAAERIGRSANISSGVVDVGRRSYTLRVEGRYDVDELEALILDWRGGLPVTLGDVATVDFGPPKREGFIYHNGHSAARLSITKTTDANVLEALEGVKAYIDELNETVFAERGLRAEYSFDPAVYINRSINLLAGNLVAGVMLAIGVLWLFLRQWRATMIIALAIPVSLLATFLVLGAAGRSLNVISLAGLAFATGMVLDAAIVVLENIVRLREAGETPAIASDKGASQVWGALLASTATTVAIFIPIMFLEDVEGQMFADLALTIAIGVSMSLLVAITILPTAARNWMRQLPPEPKDDQRWDRLADRIIGLTDTQPKRLGWVAGLMAGSILLTVLLWPESNYLPPVKRDTVDTFMFFPPGTNVDTADREIAQLLKDRLAPHLDGEKEPGVRDYFLWSFPGGTGGWLAITPEDGADLDEFQQLVQNEITAGVPDTFGFTLRRSLFGGFEDSNSVEMRLTATDLDALKPAVAHAMQRIPAVLPGASAQPQPDPFAEANELRFTPDDVRLAEVGWTREDLTRVILKLGQGVWLGEYFTGQNRVDIYLKTTRFDSPEAMAAVPVATPLGGVVPLGHVADIEIAPSPAIIIRINRSRSYSVIINPPPGMSLEALVDTIKTSIEPDLRAMMPENGRIQYAGSVQDLERAIGTLGLNFLTAIGLLVLIMAGLFRSLKDAILVVISIPLAAVGGVLAITIVNAIKFQPLDLLGMIGFIILMGLVVNNAILLVAQTRAAEAEGLGRRDAVHQALRFRLRPIFMSTLTSLFGMLPLLVVPGAGSGIYRGMAAAIVGGMSVSTLFTLLLLPSLLQLTARPRAARLTAARGAATGVAALALLFAASDVTAQEGMAFPPAKVEVTTAEVRDMAPSVEVPGTVVSLNDSRISTEIEGVLTWLADIGTPVDAGDTIARIDPRLIQVAVKSAQANVARLEAEFRYREQQLDRTENLAKTNAAAAALLDESRAQRDQAQHELEDAQAQLERAQGDLARTRIRAAFAGHVTQRLASVGEYVAVGEEIIRLVDTQRIEVALPAPMALTRYIAAGQRVRVRNGSVERTHTVRTVVPVGDAVSRMVEIRLSVDAGDWMVGAPVQVSLPNGAPVNVVAVPRDALVERGGEAFVYRVTDEGTAEQIRANIATTVGLWVGIESGVEEGDTIIIRGAERLAPGQPVEVIKPVAAR